tara:strand:- start:60 stop:2804 length:2745 start_codon:yes stop_codon:yes gene_type:complete
MISIENNNFDDTTVVVRYLTFIERVKLYLSPIEQRKSTATTKISLETVAESDEEENNFFDTDRNGSNEGTANSSITLDQPNVSNISSNSSNSSALRSSLMRPRESSITEEVGDPISEQKERELMQQEEWEKERLNWNLNDSQGWDIVRVFVSSTFNDFHGERDTLQKEVFPELNELLRSRRVRVVPVDLRWGLTKEDTSEKGLGAIEYCLREVDNSRPFFLLMEGERYGWSPPTYKISNRPEFAWVKSFPLGHAITEMEALHGFLMKPFTPCHAVCYSRDPSFITKIKNKVERQVFEFDYDTTTINGQTMKQKRDHMRMQVRDHAYCKFRTYTCDYHGKDRFGKVAVSSLSSGTGSFARMVLCDLYAQISSEFAVVDVDVEIEQQDRLAAEASQATLKGRSTQLPQNILTRLGKYGNRLRTLAKTMTSIEVERKPHEKFISFRVKNYVERKGTTNKILNKIKRHSKRIPKEMDPRRVVFNTRNNSNNSNNSNNGSSGSNSSNNTTIVLLGEPGTGKTSIMCHLSKICSNELCMTTIVHIVGSTSGSLNVKDCLVRIINEIQHRCSFVEILPSLVKQLDFSAIKSIFNRVLDRASIELGKESTHLVIFVDAVEQLGLVHGAHLLDWVPQTTSTNCTLILSCTLPVDGDSIPGVKLEGNQHDKQNKAYFKSLSQRNPQLDISLVEPLTYDEANAMQHIALKQHSKKLNENQIQLLLNKHDAIKPLYIMTACEELRIQGQYGTDGTAIDDMIRSFPGHMSAMFDFLLERLEKDMEEYCYEINHSKNNSKNEASVSLRNTVHSSSSSSSSVSSGRLVVQECLVLMTCSRNGCSEQDLLEMVGINQSIFARLYNGIWQHLRPRGTNINGNRGNGNGHNLAFYQRQLSEAVYLRYIRGQPARLHETYLLLAEFFNKRADP